MINANELRIGNWYVNQWGEYLQVDADLFGADNLESYPIPITLTREILEKCGFERQNYGWTINKLNESDDSCFCLFDMNYNSGALSLKLNAAYCPCPEVEYLHQLQNLYFSLTNKELTFKP